MNRTKRITAALLTLMLLLCGCGQPAAENAVSNAQGENTAVETADNSSENAQSDSDTLKDTVADSDGKNSKKTEKTTDSDTKTKGSDSDTKSASKEKNSDTSKDKTSDKDKSKSESSSKTTSSAASSQVNSQQEVTQTITYTVGDANDPIRKVAPEQVQQYIIEEPVIVTEPEPEATFENEYENVDPKKKVDDSWFDDCVFMGDSLSVGLSMYNDANGVFSDGKFVCASSLSYCNSQWAINHPYNVHPYYNGRKVLLEDAAVITGANKAVITLGMNDIGIWGPEGTIEQARGLLARIKAKSPELKIYLQTVTPMIYGRQKTHLNNQLIRQYNANLKNFAEQEGYGFLNSYDAFADSNGNLPYDLCSDPGGLGLHFNFKACAIWTEFIKSNIGSAYPEPESTDSDTDTQLDTDSAEDTDNEEITDTETVLPEESDTDLQEEENKSETESPE